MQALQAYSYLANDYTASLLIVTIFGLVIGNYHLTGLKLRKTWKEKDEKMDAFWDGMIAQVKKLEITK